MPVARRCSLTTKGRGLNEIKIAALNEVQMSHASRVCAVQVSIPKYAQGFRICVCVVNWRMIYEEK